MQHLQPRLKPIMLLTFLLAACLTAMLLLWRTASRAGVTPSGTGMESPVRFAVINRRPGCYVDHDTLTGLDLKAIRRFSSASGRPYRLLPATSPAHAVSMLKSGLADAAVISSPYASEARLSHTGAIYTECYTLACNSNVSTGDTVFISEKAHAGMPAARLAEAAGLIIKQSHEDENSLTARLAAGRIPAAIIGNRYIIDNSLADSAMHPLDGNIAFTARTSVAIVMACRAASLRDSISLTLR